VVDVELGGILRCGDHLADARQVLGHPGTGHRRDRVDADAVSLQLLGTDHGQGRDPALAAP